MGLRKKMTHKLSEEQKLEILELILKGYSPSDIAKKYNISRTTVYNLKKRSSINED